MPGFLQLGRFKLSNSSLNEGLVVRDLKKEGAEGAAKVAQAEAKVAGQKKVVRALNANDPNIVKEKRLLSEMEQSASSARMNKAMIDYEAEERSDGRPDTPADEPVDHQRDHR